VSNLDETIDRLQLASEALETGNLLLSAQSVDKAIDILQQLRSWCNAYPEDIFIPMTPEDWKNHHEILKCAERSGSAAAADSMRHVVNGVMRVLNQ